ncbi:hypothetical protein B0O99DRAFT_317415 [Bisporella sp. PMI_857]|nr:hypothetical protein B0O99DRAFT_317415 [Bisporella sp. PMI_857]
MLSLAGKSRGAFVVEPGCAVDFHSVVRRHFVRPVVRVSVRVFPKGAAHASSGPVLGLCTEVSGQPQRLKIVEQSSPVIDDIALIFCRSRRRPRTWVVTGGNWFGAEEAACFDHFSTVAALEDKVEIPFSTAALSKFNLHVLMWGGGAQG